MGVFEASPTPHLGKVGPKTRCISSFVAVVRHMLMHDDHFAHHERLDAVVRQHRQAVHHGVRAPILPGARGSINTGPATPRAITDPASVILPPSVALIARLAKLRRVNVTAPTTPRKAPSLSNASRPPLTGRAPAPCERPYPGRPAARRPRLSCIAAR